jgi:hypothetical protein
MNKSKTLFKTLCFLAGLGLWLITLLLGLETWFRYQLHQTEQHNIISLSYDKFTFELLGTMDSTLWKIPWYEYQRGSGFQKKINGQDYQARINGLGFRTRDIIIPKPQGSYRIVCIGGSTTMEGQTNNTTYPALLEKRLQAYFNSNRIEVLNCGISGIGASHELEKLPVYLRLEPDMLLEYNFVNDLCGKLFPRWWRKRPLWKRILTNSLFLTDMFPEQLLISKQDAEKEINSFVISKLEKIAVEAARHNVKVVFCSFACPDIAQLNKEEREFFHYNLHRFWQLKISLKTYSNLVAMYNASLYQLCKKYRLQFIPVGEYLSGGNNYFRDIVHLTGEGIEKKVDIVFNYLKDSLARQ